MSDPVRLVVGIAAATGAIVGLRLLEALRRAPGIETHLVIARDAGRVIEAETDYTAAGAAALATRAYRDDDLAAPVADLRLPTAGMVIAPCGVETAAALAHGLTGTLLTRAGDVTLREGRPLVLVPTETPLHRGHLRTLRALAEIGAVILPPMPAFYPRPRTVEELVDHTVGRVLDRFAIPHGLTAEWAGSGRRERRPDRGRGEPGRAP